MKIIALILLMSLGVYFAETIDIPLNGCGGASAATTCAKAGGESCPMCHKNAEPKKSTKGCNNASVCVDCPLCYNLLPTVYANIATVTTHDKIQYAEHVVNLIPGYNSPSWKPPNAA